jgi:hypothetical protein
MAIFNPTSMNLNLNNDPLGLGVIGRAQDARNRDRIDSFEEDINNPGWGGRGGPLPDPAWQGLLQALDEKGVDKLVGSNVPNSQAFAGQGLNRQQWGTIPDASGMQGEMAPQQLLPGYGGGASALGGLNAAFKPNYAPQVPEAPEEAGPGAWGMAKSNISGKAPFMRIQDQRGSGATNQSQRYGVPNPNRQQISDNRQSS